MSLTKVTYSMIKGAPVNVLDFGAVGDGVTDDTTAMQAALDAALGDVVVPPGQYLLSGKLTFPDKHGVALVGEGESRESANPYPCVLLFSHVGSAAVQLRQNGQALKNLVIRATGARQSGALDTTSFGVLLERADTVGSLAVCSLENIFIEGHPSHGFVSSGDVFMTQLNGIAVRDCKGHGFVMDDGTITSRTNKGRPGGTVATSLRTFKNGGHDFVLGTPDTFGSYRTIITDADFDSAGSRVGDIDPSIKIANACCIFTGENIITQNCAFGGRLSGTPTYSGFQFAGRVHRYISNRYVGVVGAAIAKENAILTTDDVTFDGVYITNDSTANPAIAIDGTIGSITVISPITTATGVLGVNNWFTAGYNKGFVIGRNFINYGDRVINGEGRITINANTAEPIVLTRDGNPVGYQIIRTGSGAAEGGVFARASGIRLESTTDVNVILTRNNVDRVFVKSNTINIVSLPTSAAGLTAGDLWNDLGTVKVA